MSALDQAFIKAYVHHEASPGPVPLDSARPVPLAEALAVPFSAEAGPVEEKPVAAVPTDALVSVLAEALEEKKASAARRRRRTRTHEDQVAQVMAGPARKPHDEAPSAAAKSSGPAVASVPAQALLGDAAISPPANSPTEAAMTPQAATCFASPETEDCEVPACDRAPQAGGEFRPLLQVDRFVWPSSVVKMGTAASDPMDNVVDRLMIGLARGRKVVGVHGCRRGDGCTTVLLATAQRLAQRGVRAIVVDADLDHPRLARRLGLATEAGWEAVLAGRLPLPEAIVESLQDRLSLLPVNGPAAGQEYDLPEHPDPATMNVLRRHYDLILVDLGRPNKRTRIDLAMPESSNSWVNTVLLVQNVRATAQTEVAQTWQRLQAAGMQDVVVVENFV
jgi:Mrp family chromosome partitioning ATPase